MLAYQKLVFSTLSKGTYKQNRTRVDTISSFHESYTIDLQKGFPLITTKKMDGSRWNSLLEELFWYLSGEEHIRNLREQTNIWNAWADEQGRLDTAYGRFWRRYPVPEQGLEGESWPDDTHRWITIEKDADGNKHRTFDQIQYAIDTLRESPHSRRVVINAWHPANAAISTLPPCHYSFVFNVQDGRLNTHLTQRSGDIALGIPFNIAAYSLLTNIIASEADLKPGEFGHTMVDAHIYCGRKQRGEWYESNLSKIQNALPKHLGEDKAREQIKQAQELITEQIPRDSEDPDNHDHIPGLLEQLNRKVLDPPQIEIRDAPIDELGPEDVSLCDYDSHGPIKFDVAE